MQMSSSFEIYVLYVQELMRRKVIGNVEKSSIADLFWTRFSKQAKAKYRETARNRNNKRRLLGDRSIKSTAFWIFAGRLMDKLNREYIPSEYIDKLYNDLSSEDKIFFAVLNDSSSTSRRNVLYKIVFDEACFLL
jgi:hypothetical protein